MVTYKQVTLLEFKGFAHVGLDCTPPSQGQERGGGKQLAVWGRDGVGGWVALGLEQA